MRFQMTLLLCCSLVWAIKMLPSGAKTEGEGFEPPVSCPTAAFKAATIDLSDILPIRYKWDFR